MLRKLGQNAQIAIPQELIRMLNLHINDYLDVRIEDQKIVLEPQLVIPKNQAYFYTKEWQRQEQQADKDIEKGQTTKTKNLKELFKKMDS